MVTEGEQKQGTNARVVKYSANGPTAMFTANNKRAQDREKMASQRCEQNLMDEEKFSLKRWVVIAMDIRPTVFNKKVVIC